MKLPIIPLLAIGAGAFFLSKKDKKPTKETKLPDVKDKFEDLPTPPKDEGKINIDDVPIVDIEDPDKPQVPDKINIDDVPINMAGFYNPFMQAPGEFPAIGDTEGLWISDTCASWGVGKDFISVAALPEKYLIANTKNPDNMLTPAQWWLKVGGDITPAPWYINNMIVDTPARGFAANLIDYWSKENGCNISPPRRSQFDTYAEYALVLQQFSKTPLGQLFNYLNDSFRDQMYIAWASKYPIQAEIESLRGWALESVRQYPTKSATDQTDIAYAAAFKDDPEAPKKIDPKNPKHKEYQNAWMRINIFVKEFRGLIKQYGY